MKKHYTPPAAEICWIEIEGGIAVSGGAWSGETRLQVLEEDENDYGELFY